MALVVGLVGEKGSGKETFGNFLMEAAKGKKVVRIRFSDILNETLMLWTIPLTRENLQHLAVVMDTGFGTGTLTDSISHKIRHMDADIIILDGIRWETDYMLVKYFPKSLLVYITAAPKLRFQRLKIRKEKKDEAQTFAQFMKEEKAKNELLIPKIGLKADFKIENNGSFESLKQQAKKFYSSIILPSLPLLN